MNVDDNKDILKRQTMELISLKNLAEKSRLKNKDEEGYMRKPIYNKNYDWGCTDAKKVFEKSMERPKLFGASVNESIIDFTTTANIYATEQKIRKKMPVIDRIDP